MDGGGAIGRGIAEELNDGSEDLYDQHSRLKLSTSGMSGDYSSIGKQTHPLKV